MINDSGNNANEHLSRRDVIKTGGATLIAMTIMPTGLILGVENAWCAIATAIKPETFATLVQACRDIYPHDHLADAFYAKVVEGFDAAAAGDANEKEFFDNGAAMLDKKAQAAHGVNYIDVGWEIQRVDILRAIQDYSFFPKIRGSLVTGIYNNPDVWPLFGYEGESASQGGYLHRGFDDINWLDQI